MHAARIDHLVIHASTLAQGAAWCERTLGVTPGPGGTHPLMGTHNRLFALGHGAYGEIIAIDPEAPQPARARWFEMDDPVRQQAAAQMPRLTHVVVQVSDLDAALAACPVDVGHATAASRGDLRWRITVRADGALPEGGMVPTLIAWQGTHPTERMPDSGVRLAALEFAHPEPDRIRAAHAAVGLTCGGPIALHYAASPKACLSAHLVRADGTALELRSR